MVVRSKDWELIKVCVFAFPAWTKQTWHAVRSIIHIGAFDLPPSLLASLRTKELYLLRSAPYRHRSYTSAVQYGSSSALSRTTTRRPLLYTTPTPQNPFQSIPFLVPRYVMFVTYSIPYTTSDFCSSQHPSYRLHCRSRFYIPCPQPPQPYL